MSTSSEIYSALIAEFGGHPKAAASLAEKLAGPWTELTVARLAERLTPEETLMLPAALRRLQRLGIVKQIVRVESRKVPGAGIGDFDDILDVPDDIHDIYQDKHIRVLPSDLRIVLTRPV